MKDQDTEEKILLAARKVFMQKGKAAASLQDIADEAGINRTLLHYYFRSKDRLYEAIFQEALQEMIRRFRNIFLSDSAIEDKVEQFVDNYIDFLLQHPHVPHFFLHELTVNPDRLIELIESAGFSPSIVVNQLTGKMDEVLVPELDSRHFVLDMLGMVIFPFVAKPLVIYLAFEGKEKQFRAFLHDRKAHLKEALQLMLNRYRKTKDHD